jgi:hypothetical protein
MNRDERLAKLEVTLQRFRKHYEIPANVLQELREKLIYVPEEVKRREQLLYARQSEHGSIQSFDENRLKDHLRNLFDESGLAGEISPDEWIDELKKRGPRKTPPEDRFKTDLIPALKACGLWKKFPLKERDKLRKRLDRRNSTIDVPANRPRWAYVELEMEYVLAIAHTLDGKFPISRSGDDRDKLGGPAFELLIAALNLALPVSGAGPNEGRASRIRELRSSISDS